MGDAEERANPALDGDDDEIYVNGRVKIERLGQYTIGIEPEDEIHRRQWEYKRVKRGRGGRMVAELDGGGRLELGGRAPRERTSVGIDTERKRGREDLNLRVFDGMWELDAGTNEKEEAEEFQQPEVRSDDIIEEEKNMEPEREDHERVNGGNEEEEEEEEQD